MTRLGKIKDSGILKLFGANSISQACNILGQILSVPLFLSFWTLEEYGTWLMLATIPAYLGLADLGLAAAAGTQMTLHMAKGDKAQAQAILSTLVSCMAIIGLLLVILIWIPEILIYYFKTQEESAADIYLAIAILAVSCGITLQSAPYDAALRAIEKFHVSITANSIVRLIEVGIVAALACTFRSYSAAALGMLTSRLLGVLVIKWAYSAQETSLRHSISVPNMAILRQLTKPSVGYMLFPVSNILSLQTLTLITGFFASTSDAAILSIYRTLARIVVQTTGIVSNSFFSHFSRCWAEARISDLKVAYRNSEIICAASGLAATAVLIATTSQIITIWTKSQVEENNILLWICLAYGFFASIWHTPRILLIATNQHTRLGIVYLFTTLATFAGALILAAPLGVIGVMLAACAGEFAVSLLSRRYARSMFSYQS